jgi:hypothetical protein
MYVYLGATSYGEGSKAFAPRLRNRGVWWTVRRARLMALSFFLPVCSSISLCARRGLGVSYAADLVIQVLEPPFRDQVALQFPAEVSYVGAVSFGPSYFANFMMAVTTRQKKARGSHTIPTQSAAIRPRVKWEGMWSHCSGRAASVYRATLHRWRSSDCAALAS